MESNALRQSFRLAVFLVLLWICGAAPAIADTGEAPSSEPAVQIERPPPPPENDPLAQRVGDLHGRAHTIRTEALSRSALSRDLSSLANDIQAQRKAFEQAYVLPPASADRAPAIDAAYAALRGLRSTARARRDAALESLEAIAEEEASSVAPDAAPALLEASQALSEAIRFRGTVLQDQLVRSDQLLRDVTDLRRTVRPHVSTPEPVSLDAIVSELLGLPVDLQMRIMSHSTPGVDEPTIWRRIQTGVSVLADAATWVGLILLAVFVHRQLPAWIAALLSGIDPRSGGKVSHWEAARRFPPWMVAGDVPAAAQPLTALSRSAVEIGVALYLVGELQQLAPFLAWLALAVAVRGAVQGAGALANLVVITPEDTRPALRVTSIDVRDSLLWTIAVFGWLWAAEILVVGLIDGVLGLAAVGVLVSMVVGVLLWGIAFIALVHWTPTISARVGEGESGSGLGQWVARGPNGVRGILHGLVGLVLLICRWVLYMGTRVVESRAGLSWLAAALARRQLRDVGEDTAQPIGADSIQAIESDALVVLDLSPEAAAVQAAWKEWCAERRQGLVAIMGDRGMGVPQLMEDLKELLDGDAPLVRLQDPPRLHSERAVLEWLGGQLGIAECDTVDAMAAALTAGPSQVFLVPDLHRLFLRSVGCFAGLDAAIRLMQSTGHHHFWVCGIHGPAWSFLDGVDDVAPLSVFRTLVPIQGRDPHGLARWLEARTRAAGMTPRFDALMLNQARGPDRARMLQRVSRAYWRLLTEASQGNPEVAVHLWARGLSVTSDPSVVDVGLFSAPEADDLDGLSDDALFVLTAIVVHDRLTVPELAHVLNMPVATVRGLCRSLEDRGIVTPVGTELAVSLLWLPAVERRLRRHSFLHRR